MYCSVCFFLQRDKKNPKLVIFFYKIRQNLEAVEGKDSSVFPKLWVATCYVLSCNGVVLVMMQSITQNHVHVTWALQPTQLASTGIRILKQLEAISSILPQGFLESKETSGVGHWPSRTVKWPPEICSNALWCDQTSCHDPPWRTRCVTALKFGNC